MENKKIIYDAHVNFYMRIYDSYMYGGKGSVGYAMESLEHCRNFDSLVVDKVAEEVKTSMSKALEVPPDKIEFISYQEYEDSTCEEDDDFEDTGEDE